MKDDEQTGTGSRRPWVTPAMVEEDCAATESGGAYANPDDGLGFYDSTSS